MKMITRIIKNRFRGLKHLGFALLLASSLLANWQTVSHAAWGATVPNPIMEYNYTYDNNGNITKIEDKVNGTGYNQDFTYDEVDRLSSAIGPYGNQSYTYDAVGNTVDITPPVTNTYDNGNIIDYNGKHIEYDYENRPVRITNSNNNTVTEFAYDYSGQRVYKKVSSGTLTSEDYYVGNIYEESYSVDSSNPISASTTTVTYVYAGSIRIAGLTSQITTSGTENNTCYYHGDHLGSSSIITDGSGTVVRNISYQPWGNVQSNTEESGASTLDPNHKFTGQMLDDSTNLYYYGARYYDPTLRRFITPDTIVQSPYDPQSLNRYAYCRNNPLIYTDPTGNSWVSETWKRNKVPIVNTLGVIVTAGTIWLTDGAFVVTFGYDTSGEQNKFIIVVKCGPYAIEAEQENKKWSVNGQGSWNFSGPSRSSNKSNNGFSNNSTSLSDYAVILEQTKQAGINKVNQNAYILSVEYGGYTYADFGDTLSNSAYTANVIGLTCNLAGPPGIAAGATVQGVAGILDAGAMISYSIDYFANDNVSSGKQALVSMGGVALDYATAGIGKVGAKQAGYGRAYYSKTSDRYIPYFSSYLKSIYESSLKSPYNRDIKKNRNISFKLQKQWPS